MIFVDREAEFKALKESYSQKRSSLVAVYGRRRIGKTDLITRFARSMKGSIYYMATKEGDQKQLKGLSSLIGLELGDDELARFGAVDWEALFLRIKNRPGKRRILIAIDDFPYLAGSNSAISSIFQKGWDLYLKDANVMLVLCGSSISMMHSEVLDYSAPLYQRSTSILEMRPLGIKYALFLNQKLKFEDKMYLYFIFGGIPAYYSYTEKCSSLSEVISDIFKQGSIFLDEPSTILSEETKNEARYIDILDLISNGINRTNEIASKAGIQPSNTSRYLDVLERIGIIGKIFPVTGKQDRRSKRGIYEIKDNYLRFWFRYIKRNREAINTSGASTVAKKVAGELSAIGGIAFESFAAELVRLLSGKQLPLLSKVGKWWGKDPNKRASAGQEEIDIVGINEDTKDILFAECKWTNSKADAALYKELKRKASLVLWNIGTRKDHFAIFSKSGFTNSLKSIAEEERVDLFDLGAIEKILAK